MLTLSQQAQASLTSLNPAAYIEALTVIYGLLLDPRVNNFTTFAYEGMPYRMPVRFLKDDEWFIVYRALDNGDVHIISIELPPTSPH